MERREMVKEVGHRAARAACRKRTQQIGGCENIDQIPTPGLFKNTWPKPLLCSFKPLISIPPALSGTPTIFIPRVTLRGWGGE